MRIFVGTSGYSYAAWKGSFYPAELPAGQMLRFYAQNFSAVEINNTFYRMPRASMLAGWCEQVPDGFRFALKASQQITHRKRLKDCAEPLAFFLQTSTTLGDRLGPVLFQLPPNFRKDLPRLQDFLALLPPACRAAFEFRHESWFDEDVLAALSAAPAALCVNEDESLSAPLAPTTDWGYLRLRRQEYDSEALVGWAARIRQQAWKEVFVFFKHEDEARGPLFAREMTKIFADENPNAARLLPLSNEV